MTMYFIKTYFRTTSFYSTDHVENQRWSFQDTRISGNSGKKLAAYSTLVGTRVHSLSFGLPLIDFLPNLYRI